MCVPLITSCPDLVAPNFRINDTPEIPWPLGSPRHHVEYRKNGFEFCFEYILEASTVFSEICHVHATCTSLCDNYESDEIIFVSRTEIQVNNSTTGNLVSILFCNYRNVIVYVY